GNLTIREENAAAALEVMSRFAVDPRWLIYLPPTMSPSETSALPDYLEHPAEAFAYYRNHGIQTVVCEEKHMGSRAVIVVCRDEAAARRRFGIDGEDGIIFTRTGRRFFNDSRSARADEVDSMAIGSVRPEGGSVRPEGNRRTNQRSSKLNAESFLLAALRDGLSA